MVEVNHKDKYMRAKIIYYGPAACGKTTNLRVIHRLAKHEKKLDLFSVNSAQDRTILFDLLPLSTPAFRSYQLRFQLVGVPGQKLYAATRKMILKSADSVVFVANSAADRWGECMESFKEMTKFLLEHGIDPATLPIVFQYNKQDLPETTDMAVMERVLNARGAEYFPAIASDDKGVLETFAAVLRTTMAELARRYKISSEIPDAHTTREWTEQTMLQTFGVSKFGDQSEYELEEPADSAFPEPEVKVVRVKTPSKPRIGAESPATSSPQELTRAPSSLAASTEDLSTAANEPQEVTAGAATVASPESDYSGGVSAAAEVQDESSAMAMVESYAEAAVGLADHIADLREQRDSVARQAADFSTVADSVAKLLNGSADAAPGVLQELIKKIASNWEASHASLSILRPDGKLIQLVRHGLELDPLESSTTSEEQATANAILEGGKRVVQMLGDEGPLDEVIKRVSLQCVGAAAYPLGVKRRPLGLLVFYFSQGAPALSLAEAEHLDRVGFQLSLGLQANSENTTSPASWKPAFLGQMAEGAIRWTGQSAQSIGAAVAHLRAQAEAPPWLEGELLKIENALLHLKSMRQTVAGVTAGELPSPTATQLAGLLKEIQTELNDSLTQNGIAFQVEVKQVKPVLADPFLLRGVIYSLVAHCRRRLRGIASGGVIRILVKNTGQVGQICIFNNAAALMRSDDPSLYLSWPLERQLTGMDCDLVRMVMDHFQGQWSVQTREKVGTLWTLALKNA